jgi:V8-like Glu-specific endopeptidase
MRFKRLLSSLSISLLLSTTLLFPAQVRGQTLPNDPSACLEVSRDTLDLEGLVKTWRDTTLANANETGNFAPLLNPDSIRVTAEKGTDDSLWTTTPDGGRVWCLEIKSSTYPEGSLSGPLALVFDTFSLPTNSDAELRIYDDNESQVLGPFTSDDNASGGFITDSVCFSDCGRISLIVAYYEPPGTSSDFLVSDVIHNFAGLDSPGGSASCNLNASLAPSCTLSIPWAKEIRATVQIIGMNYGGGRPTAASGFLINNVTEDLTPYMMVAHHSIDANIDDDSPEDFFSGGNVQIARFNYQASSCGTGTVTQTPDYHALNVDDAEIHAYEDYPHDYALLELPSQIPQSSGVYYAGWSRDGNLPQEGTVTGHPKNDVKKISFASSIREESSALWETDFDGTNDGAIQNSHSGSPLFDEYRRIIGQVYGGPTGCNATYVDFPKFSENWDAGYDDGSEEYRLKEYLDPNATGRMTLPPVAGYDLDIAGESFADSTTDRASGLFRTAGRIDVEDVTVESDSRLVLRAREGIRIEGPFTARAGSRFEARIDEGPTLTGLGIPETYDDLSTSTMTVAGGGPQSAGGASKANGEPVGSETSSSGKRKGRRAEIPEQVTLEPNYPNPFRTQTTIRYGLPEETHVQVVVYDVLGRRVATLVDEHRRAGYHRVTWTPDSFPTGTYLYRLRAGTTTRAETMTIVR